MTFANLIVIAQKVLTKRMSKSQFKSVLFETSNISVSIGVEYRQESNTIPIISDKKFIGSYENGSDTG